MYKSDFCYIAEIVSVFPRNYKAEYIADKLYPIEVYGDVLNKMIKRMAKQIGIPQRGSVIDLDAYPKITLKSQDDHPKTWGIKAVNYLTNQVSKSQIGYFGLAYNISSHTDVLPNLASQIVMESGIENVKHNRELPYYGCAAGINLLQEACEYCRTYDRPAILFVYDHPTRCALMLDKNDPDFKKMMISNLLFADAGVGVLIIPDSMRSAYPKPLLKVIDTDLKYIPGDLIAMRNRKFLMDLNLKQIMPKLVSDQLIKPFLEKNHLLVNQIHSWCIHQGGTELIKQFCQKDVLNLIDKDIKHSLDMFYKYGNVSTPSCFLVLEDYFNNPMIQKILGSKIMLFGFGAGYYLGVSLLEYI